MKADSKTEAQVMAVLNTAHEAYARRDIEGMLACFAPDPDVVLIGTGADERRVGLAEIRTQAERDWSQSEASAVELGWYAVSTAGSGACVAADMAFKVTIGGQEMSLPGRFTAALEKRGERWLVVQAHYSVPMAGQEEGESFPA